MNTDRPIPSLERATEDWKDKTKIRYILVGPWAPKEGRQQEELCGCKS